MTSPSPLPLEVGVKDAKGNGISGILASFSDGGAGGTLSSPTATTDSSGFASTSYTTGTKSGTVAITASVAGLTPVVFKGTVPGPQPPSTYVRVTTRQSRREPPRRSYCRSLSKTTMEIRYLRFQ